LTAFFLAALISLLSRLVALLVLLATLATLLLIELTTLLTVLFHIVCHEFLLSARRGAPAIQFQQLSCSSRSNGWDARGAI
jgi:hypothetical protein